MSGHQRRVDRQFLAMVAVGLAVVTRSVIPALLMTAAVALVMFGYEAAVRRHRRRIDFGASPAENVPAPSDTDPRWMPVLDRMLRSND